MQSHKIINVSNPSAAQDVATKQYTDTQIATRMASSATLNSIASLNPATSDISVNSFKITNLQNPTLT